MNQKLFRLLASFPRPAWWLVALGCWCGVLASGAQAQDCIRLNGATNLGPILTPVSLAGSLGASESGFFYSFTVSGSVREVTASIPASSLISRAQVELSLLLDANNNGIVDSSDPVFSDYAGSGADAALTMWLEPGTYFVRVCGTSTTFQMNLTQTPRAESPGNGDNTLLAPNLRTLYAGVPLRDFVGFFDTADYVKFTVTEPVAEVVVSIPGSSLPGLGRSFENAEVKLKLLPFGSQGNDQVFVSDDAQSRGSDDAQVSLWLDSGTYFVKVENPSNRNNIPVDGTSYQLKLTKSAKLFSPGNADNSCATARLLLPRAPTNDFVGISDLADYYKVVVSGQPATVEATIPYTSLSHAVRLTLLANCGGGELTNSVGDPSYRSRSDAVVSNVLAPGTYYLKVEPKDAADYEDNTTYLLSLSAPEPPLPAIQVSGDLSFGDVATNTTATRTLTINNTGTDVLNVSGINYPPGFSGSFSGAIAVGGSTNVTVTFAPVSAGTNGGTVTVNSDAISGIYIRPISGRGVSRVLALSSLINFGNVEALQRTNRTLAITNRGNVALTVSGITFPEGFSGSYTGAIPPNSFVNVPVTFAPTNVTSYGGALEVLSDRTAGANTTTLSGTGTVVLARTIRLIGSLNFGGVEALRSSNRVFVITNSGVAPFTVTSIDFPEGFTGTFMRGVLNSNGWRSVEVMFSPANASIAYGGPVIVNSPDANSGTNTIQASGTGTPILTRVIGLGGNLAFGEVQARSNATRMLFITNSGVAPLAVSGISYPTGFSGVFSGNSNILPGEVRSVMVKFKPETAGSYTGLVAVLSDKNSGKHTREISGTARPAPLRAVEGTYQGVFRETRDWVHASSGFFTLTVPKGGASYSGKILLDGQAWSISGKFDFDGNASNLILRKGRESLLVEWHADPEGADQITGLIATATDPVNWKALLLGRRAVYALKPNDAPQAGRHTMLLGVIPGADNSPQGDGFGTVTVSARGVITLVGTLADGTKVTQAATLSRGGDWPLYLGLYKGGGGSLQGSPVFASPPGRDLSASGKWFRPAMIKTIYPAGFAVETAITGSRYVAPTGKTNRVVAITNALVRLTGGGFALMKDFPVLLSANNKVVNESLQKLSMRIDTATGLFSGSVTSEGAKTALPFQGVFLQSSNPIGYGAGYFLRENLSGRVEFKIAP